MSELTIRISPLDPRSIGRTLRDAGTRLRARLPEILTNARERLTAALKAVRELFVLPPPPLEGTCVVLSELSARCLGTIGLAVALRLPPPAVLFLALAVTLLSIRHVMAGYLGTRLLRETGELLGGILEP